MPSDFEAYVVVRLDELESKNRRQRRLAMGLSVVAAGQGLLLLYLLLPVSGWLCVPKTIEASRFVLVDDRGRMRAELHEDQGPSLTLFTEDGQERATIWVNNNGGAFVLLMDSREGAGRVASLAASDDESGVWLGDGRGASASLLLNDKKSAPSTVEQKEGPVRKVLKP